MNILNIVMKLQNLEVILALDPHLQTFMKTKIFKKDIKLPTEQFVII